MRDKVRGTASGSHRGGTVRDCSVLLLVEIQRCSYHRQKKALKVLLEVSEGRRSHDCCVGFHPASCFVRLER